MNTIAKIIKEERTLRKMTQDELAKVLGVTQDSISLWEKGKRIPDTIYIIELCKYFDISADYLLCLKDIDGSKIEQSEKTINDNRKYNIKTKNHSCDINIK